MDEQKKEYIKLMLRLKFSNHAEDILTDEQVDTLIFGIDKDKEIIVNAFIKEKVVPQKEAEVAKIQADYATLTEKQSEVSLLTNLTKI
jgi:hypothetical protein